MGREKLHVASPATTVSDAARLMREDGAGAVAVVDSESLVGIFTERDAVARVVALELDARTTRLVDVMTPAPMTVGPEVTFGHALRLMHEHGFHQVPVVENGRLIGMVSSRDALDSELVDFVCEARRREAIR